MRFLEYPELELSNNLADNSVRPVAVGRKNWGWWPRLDATLPTRNTFQYAKVSSRLHGTIGPLHGSATPGAGY